MAACAEPLDAGAAGVRRQGRDDRRRGRRPGRGRVRGDLGRPHQRRPDLHRHRAHLRRRRGPRRRSSSKLVAKAGTLDGRRRRRRGHRSDHHAGPDRHDPAAHRRRPGTRRYARCWAARRGHGAVRAPTILVDVPEDFGGGVRGDVRADPDRQAGRRRDEAIRLANGLRYGLGGSVFGKRDAMRIARPAALRHDVDQLDARLRRHAEPAVRRRRRLRLRPHPR